MSIKSKEVKIQLRKDNIDFYKSKGYKIPDFTIKSSTSSIPSGNFIDVKIGDLPKNCNAKIECVCDNCGKITINTYGKYNERLRDGKSYCNNCAKRLFGNGVITRMNKEEIEKVVNKKLGSKWSFFNIKTINSQTCVDLKDDKNYMYSEVYVSNIKKGKIPRPIHSNNRYTIENINNWCKLSNAPVKLIQDTYVSCDSDMKWLCLSCNGIFYRTWDNLNRESSICPSCSDGISYPEKFVRSLLSQLEVNHITQLSKKTFKWCDKFRYDEYLLNEDVIIEIHGKQHYEESGRAWGSLIDVQKNDELKKQLAFLNGYNNQNYIIIDARYSTLKHIKNSILKSKLPHVLGFIEGDVDWIKCHEESLKSMVKQACDIWNSGIHNAQKIALQTNLSSSTIVRYLKQGATIGLCDYDSDHEIRKKILSQSIKVYCFELNKIFDSMLSVEKELGINNSNVSACCKGKTKTAGGYHWIYYEDYLKLHSKSAS